MIQTPSQEKEDPFSSASANQALGGTVRAASKSNKGVQMLSGIDDRLKSEAAKSKLEEVLVEEFDDKFVTQVYNYLSLGYPALARQYDGELAKIAHMSEEELRADDAKKIDKGYIGLVEGSGSAGQGHCARWRALRLYILEWGRQHPALTVGSVTPSAWGVRARRGSWAI